jgi:hypothetical protein
MIEKIREFIATCPYLDTKGNIYIEWLGNEAVEYSIEETPSNPIISENIDGSTTRQLTFTFASREWYSKELIQNIANSNFYKNFAEWLELQTLKGDLPDIGEGKTPYKIEATSSGYLFNTNAGLQTARYQIQCRLLYEQDELDPNYSI